MKKYRVYQDGELNFTIQGPEPENATLAIFSVKKSENNHKNYSISRVDLRISGFPNKQEIYLGEGKEKTTNLAYLLAINFALALDSNFDDKTSFAKQKPNQLEKIAKKEEDDLSWDNDEGYGGYKSSLEY